MYIFHLRDDIKFTLNYFNKNILFEINRNNFDYVKYSFVKVLSLKYENKKTLIMY